MGAIEGGALVRGLSAGGAVRVIGVDARLAAEDARRLHHLSPSAAELCAQGIVAAALLSALIKGEERLTIQIQASEPQMSFFAEIDAEGGVRARTSPTTARAGTGGRMTGILLAIKSDATREMYRGMTAIDGQTLEEALEHHLGTSSQIDAILRLEARAGPGGVEVASGVLVERMPEELGRASMEADLFRDRFGGLPRGEARSHVEGLRFCKLLDQGFEPLEDREIVWRCRCSQEKVEGMLQSLGLRELTEMADEDHGAEVTCHFCNSVYRVGEDRLRALAHAIV